MTYTLFDMWRRLFLALLTATILSAQATMSPEQRAQQLTAMHNAWGPAASSPALSLRIVEESQTGADFRYGLRAKGAAPATVFTLLSWPVTQQGPTEVLQGVTFNDLGVAVCAGRPGTCGDPAVPNDPIHIPFRPVPGEPIRLAIISSDGSMKAFSKIVPLPLHGEDKTCRVDASLLTPGAELLFIEGTGFAPNGELTMSGDSEGEKHDFRSKTDAQGRFTSALLPFKQGLSHGTIHIVLKGSACSPGVSVAWGRG